MPVNLKASSLVDVALDALLPSHCLLCGARGQGALSLCAACEAEMPRNTMCCARCALPLEAPAPLCGRCVKREAPWDAAWAPFRYEWPLAQLESRFKFGGDLAAGRTLSLLWMAASVSPVGLPQAIVPVPLHRSRLRKRGYNQALELAKPLAKHLGIPLLRDALRRTRATNAQTELTAVQRRRNVRGAFVANLDGKAPPHVAVLDDVFTTGATLAECARVLKRAGVQRVDVWALARASARL
ncbi:MAG: ComF family protein [Rhodanobacteraceae bacterium]|jgi:ComF family protein|nr:MAG: ComF family protein [Rhodanobacteraceae bacterium]